MLGCDIHNVLLSESLVPLSVLFSSLFRTQILPDSIVSPLYWISYWSVVLVSSFQVLNKKHYVQNRSMRNISSVCQLLLQLMLTLSYETARAHTLSPSPPPSPPPYIHTHIHKVIPHMKFYVQRKKINKQVNKFSTFIFQFPNVILCYGSMEENHDSATCVRFPDLFGF